MFATMDDAVSDCMNVGDVLTSVISESLQSGPAKDKLDRRARVPDWFRKTFWSFPFGRKSHDSLSADAFDRPWARRLSLLLDQFEVGRNKLKLD